MKVIQYLFLCLLTLASCVENEYIPDFDNEEVEGFKPVYAIDNENKISKAEPREIGKAGKIYVYNNLLLVNEVGLGIHVFDNTDKLNPVKKYFLEIAGNRDVAIKDGVLFADSFNNLLAINVSEDSAFVLKEIENVTAGISDFPPRNGVYFECIDESKGKIIDWEYVLLENPQCYRP